MPQIYKKVKRIRHAHKKRGSQKRTLTGRRPLFRVSEIKKGGRHAHEKRGSQKRTLTGRRPLFRVSEIKKVGATPTKKEARKSEPLFLWALTDSNRRPSACKADALNQLS